MPRVVTGVLRELPDVAASAVELARGLRPWCSLARNALSDLVVDGSHVEWASEKWQVRTMLVM